MDRNEQRGPPRTRLHAAMGVTLSTLLLACVACPFAPAEPTEATSDAAAPPMGTTLWHELFAGLARAADRGDAQAARIALEMYRSAPQVYGGHFDATPAQLQAWRCRADGREPPCVVPAPVA